MLEPIGHCLNCGAPIYGDAHVQYLNSGGVPPVYWTCQCRDLLTRLLYARVMTAEKTTQEVDNTKK